jgi:hypothetical protein
MGDIFFLILEEIFLDKILFFAGKVDDTGCFLFSWNLAIRLDLLIWNFMVNLRRKFKLNEIMVSFKKRYHSASINHWINQCWGSKLG